jgi:hypothetical protein
MHEMPWMSRKTSAIEYVLSERIKNSIARITRFKPIEGRTNPFIGDVYFIQL